MPSTSTDRLDGLSTSVAVKAPVKAVATSNITLSGEQSVNGTAVVSGDRVLCVGQTSAVDNGIYEVSTSAWSRTPDFDGRRDVRKGTLVVSNQDTSIYYRVTSNDPIRPSVDAITFESVAGGVSQTSIGLTLYPRSSAEISASITPSYYFYPVGWAPRYGATGDGSTDDAAALQKIKTLALAGVRCHLPKPAVHYKTSQPLIFTAPVHITADPETRIKLSASASYVVRFDYTGGSPAYDHGGYLDNVVLDGGGFATDGLSLKGVISATFPNVRVTNVTTAGLHLHWAQLCHFENFICSDNVETFTTTPVNGILADTASCSANIFVNPTIEHVSGAGIKGISLVNTLFLNGTSEGNDIGIDLGESPAVTLTAVGNTFVGMDLEVNATTDIILRASAQANEFISLKAGYASPAVQLKSGAIRNNFIGGTTGGFDFEAGANHNSIDSVNLLGTGRTVTDAGTANRWRNVFNYSDATRLPDSTLAVRTKYTVAGGGSATIDASTADLVIVECTGSTATINAPTNPRDGQRMRLCLWNTSGGALTVTLNASAFKADGFTAPATGKNRTYDLDYNGEFDRWYMAQQSAADVTN
jgi:hypothetical protein